MARNGLRALAHLAPHLPALAALDLAGNWLSDDGELKFLAALPALASISLADTALSRKQERSVCLTSTPTGILSRRKLGQDSLLTRRVSVMHFGVRQITLSRNVLFRCMMLRCMQGCCKRLMTFSTSLELVNKCSCYS